MDWAAWLGVAGCMCVVGAYAALIEQKLTSDGFLYSFVNLVGGILLMISLFSHFNAGSMMIEVFQIGISLRGLYLWRANKNRQRLHDQASEV